MGQKDLYQIIKYLANTEKSNMLTEKDTYTLKVLKGASKPQIKKAVELAFDVKVLEVRTLITKGKSKIFKGRKGKRSDSKKALIKLESGQKLDLNLGAK